MSEDGKLEEAIESAKAEPENEKAWDQLEDAASAAQSPDEVADLYRDVLNSDLSPRLAAVLGQRAVNWLEEWFGESSPRLIDVLERVLALDPSAQWAFQRLTVVHTAAGRWDDLFSLYDRSLEDVNDDDRKRTLLDEAANVAKEFAGDSARAIAYMRRLLPLSPDDEQLAASLERLLEREEGWEDLITLWRDRRDRVKGDAAQIQISVRIGETYFDRLGQVSDALSEASDALTHGGAEEGPNAETALALVERIAGSEDVEEPQRRRALDLLKKFYQKANREADVVRVLEASLGLASSDSRPSLHREAAQRLFEEGDREAAMGHYASLLRLDPGARDALERLRELTNELGQPELLARVLVESADLAQDAALRVALRVEAADLHRSALSDVDGAIGLYQKVIDDDGAAEGVGLNVARRLNELLAATDRKEERLVALERLAETEPNPIERKVALGQIARVAYDIGNVDHALEAWNRRLSTDETDLEALNGIVDVLERESRWDDLVAALHRRASGPVPPLGRRADLVRVARVQEEELETNDDAIATWKSVAEAFGEVPETVDGLARLYAKNSAWSDLAELLSRAATREADHVASIYGRLGEVQGQHLNSQTEAVKALAHAVRIDPRHEVALAGLKELLGQDECMSEAAEALRTAYGAVDDWASMVGLLEYRLVSASNSFEQVRILRETARVNERRGDDQVAALGCMRRAMALAPNMRDIEADVFRLAESTERWDLAIEAIRDAVEALGPKSSRSRYLRFWEGKICENYLDDEEAALSAYDHVFSEEPTRIDAAEAVVRNASVTGGWDRVADVLLTASHALDAMPLPLPETVERVTSHADAWDILVDKLEAGLDAREDLSPAVGRDLELMLGDWHSRMRDDVPRAEEMLARAVRWDDTHVPTLRALAEVQRRSPGRPLFTTLVRLAELSDDDLDPLREATEVAVNNLDDLNERRQVADRLYREAARLWKRNTKTTGEHAPAECARWALDQLVAVYDQLGELGAAVAVMADAAYLPVSGDESRALRRRAATVAAEIGDRSRAIVLYRGILDEAPDDQETLAQLADICEAEGRLPEMMALRQHELGLTQDPERRLVLRLDLARIVGEMEKRGGRVQSLLKNLEERTGHEDSVAALIEVLETAHRFEELTDVLSNQATQLEEQSQLPLAAQLWAKVAQLSEEHLEDVDRALTAHRRVVDLASTTVALDALARLHTNRSEHQVAARWLERRLEASEGDEHADVALRLAKAHLGADDESPTHPQKAQSVLEAALALAPERHDVRSMLAERYRADGADLPLAALLTSAATYLEDREVLLKSSREAAEISRRLGTPQLATPLLERALSFAPEERDVKLALASAYYSDDRMEEAETLLRDVIESYGRRRNSDRAAAHHLLGQVLHRSGNQGEALEQLEQASKMDVSNPTILRTLGTLALSAGELDRSERAFRALLLMVRRTKGGGVDQVGASEVLFSLHEIASARQDTSQAEELLASASDEAVQDNTETRRFVRTLQDRGRFDAALQVLSARRKLEPSVEGRAELDLVMGKVLISGSEDQAHVNRDEGENRLLSAVRGTPSDMTLHAQVKALLASVNRLAPYEALLTELARDAKDAELGSDLYLLAGAVAEKDRGDFDAARAHYERAEILEVKQVDAWFGLARVAARRGDAREQERVLDQLVNSESAIDDDVRTDAMYRAAELKFTDKPEEGLSLLKQALARDPQPERAAKVLREATDTNGGEPEALSVYERVARGSSDSSYLLDYLRKRAAKADVNLTEMREGAALARTLDRNEDEERMLLKAMDIVEASEEGLGEATLWVPTELADVRRRVGDVAGALDWTRRAASVAPPEEARGLLLSAAELAANPDGGDLVVAAETYEQLLEDDRTDALVYAPLLAVYVRQGDEDKLNDLASSLLDGLIDLDARSSVRMVRAHYLVSLEGREPDAANELRAVLEDDTGHQEAAGLLADLFERTGYDEDLVDLLSGQLDVARDNQDLEQIHDLTLRLGELVGKVRRADALDVYRRGLDWLPQDRDVCQALLNALGPEDDPRERIEITERLLTTETGPGAAELALSLSEQWAAAGDSAGVLRSLELGYKGCPEDSRVREQLEGIYREQGLFEPLAEFTRAEAARATDPMLQVALYRSAAGIQQNDLGNAAMAAVILAEARSAHPEELGLLTDLVDARRAAGDLQSAIGDVEAALDEAGGEREAVPLLQLRAQLLMQVGSEEAAIQDLERAYAAAPADVSGDLCAALRNQLVSLADSGDREAERVSTLRIVKVLDDSGDKEEARRMLADWTERVSSDREALNMLRDIDEKDANWAGLAETLSKLVRLEEEENQIDAALRLADAYHRAGTPELARGDLEFVHGQQPNQVLRKRLQSLYESTEAHGPLAAFMMEDAEQEADEDARYELIRAAGDRYLRAGDSASAMSALQTAVNLRPTDHGATILLVDSYIAAEEFPQAGQMLETAIAAHTRRRSPELAELQHRMAHLGAAAGDRHLQMQWLNAALASDKTNGNVAAELAQLAMDLGDHDVALNALRVVTLNKTEGPMSRATAFLLQAQIAHQRGEARRAILWARKARSEDPELEAAAAFLAELGES